ncbi:hypothetical protein [Lentzea sp. HUAS12]|uniref:hypothetical protein n=1 Tax=Lentzea sp. HUAS12 TaxID=2951806 RepID=UPI00209CA636|nr:hypothetical protein [Lentzea sp. HUAS12]USX53971.1 hypothetical protein ND450_07675 [Lentzea sp. HUAS12]
MRTGIVSVAGKAVPTNVHVVVQASSVEVARGGSSGPKLVRPVSGGTPAGDDVGTLDHALDHDGLPSVSRGPVSGADRTTRAPGGALDGLPRTGTALTVPRGCELTTSSR